MLQQLSAFYRQHNPEQFSKIPQLIEKFQDDEDALNRALKLKYGVNLEDIATTPIIPIQRLIPVHHPQASRMTRQLLLARSTDQLLDVWEQEKDEYGWATALKTIERIAKVHRGSPTSDSRMAELAGFVEQALLQGNMSSTSRMGHSTDDLGVLLQSLTKLGMGESELASRVQKQIDADEEGDIYADDESEVVAQG